MCSVIRNVVACAGGQPKDACDETPHGRTDGRRCVATGFLVYCTYNVGFIMRRIQKSFNAQQQRVHEEGIDGTALRLFSLCAHVREMDNCIRHVADATRKARTHARRASACVCGISNDFNLFELKRKASALIASQVFSAGQPGEH